MFSKSGPRKRSNLPIVWGAASLFCALAAFFFPASAASADKLKELQARFDHESRSGSKIKELDKLGLAQFEAATQSGASGDYVAVGLTFEKYRDNVREAFELLRKQQPDADHHAGEYRQLELVVRRGIREVEETLLVVPQAVRPPLELVRKDLIATDDALINFLFPRRSKDPSNASPAPEQKP